MSGLLLDTSAVIGCFERRDPTIADMIARANSSVHVSVLTVGELHVGVAADSTPARAVSLQAAQTMTMVDVDAEIGPACFGFIAGQLPPLVGRIDCWIAATAVIGRYELVTQDDVFAERLGQLDWTPSAWRAPAITHIPVAT